MSKEAETLRYDSRTPKFEGIAHEQVDGDEELEWMEGGVEGARKRANNFPAFLREMNAQRRQSHMGRLQVQCALRSLCVQSSGGIDCRRISYSRQIVCCGIGQDYHYLR
jgi:hypothetical protein